MRYARGDATAMYVRPRSRDVFADVASNFKSSSDERLTELVWSLGALRRRISCQSIGRYNTLTHAAVSWATEIAGLDILGLRTGVVWLVIDVVDQ